ncbi:site-specific recombinase XerD [Paraburkholderia sp. BL8N3]|nr:integrase arm-type DNA-binding domain-containing protein [Paraburkholderia sp. BL8N3]TCK43489.1 site-specific recombinase XerD [Paraburkholderia sp. BL8N3]
MALSDIKIRHAKATGKAIKLTDSNGLYLEVKPNGSKLWRYRYRIDGKENVFAIGDYPAVALQSARQQRDAARELVKQGINPAHRRQAEKQKAVDESRETFRTVANEWLEKMKPRWSDLHYEQIKTVLAADAYPRIGHMAMRSITARQILDIVQRVEARGAPTVAVNLRTWCSAVFRYAVVTLRADSDPAAVLKGSVIRPHRETSRALSVEELQALSAKLDVYGNARTRIAVRLLILFFVRTVELRTAEWDEFDEDAMEWRIPASKMKSRRLHIVPISRQAAKLLRQLRVLTGKGDYLFPRQRKTGTQPYMSRSTINHAIEYMLPEHPEPITAHDFRATAATHLREMGWKDELVEMQLAHLDGNTTRAAYNHAKYLPERRKMMQAWSDWIERLVAESEAQAPVAA